MGIRNSDAYILRPAKRWDFTFICLLLHTNNKNTFICLSSVYVKVKVKVKVAPEQTTKTQRGSRGIALVFP